MGINLIYKSILEAIIENINAGIHVVDNMVKQIPNNLWWGGRVGCQWIMV